MPNASLDDLPVRPAKFAIQVLAHQILAQALQFYGIRRDVLWKVAQSAQCFSGIARQDYDLLLDHLVKTDILNQADGLYVFGKTGEKQFGRQNFLRLYSVFETPEEIKVLTADRRVIGTLQAWFVQLTSGKGEMIFILAGQAWLAKHIDLEAGEMIVSPAPRGAIPRWNSGGALIGREIANAMRSCLASEEAYPFLTQKAQQGLDKMRREWSALVTAETIPLRPHGREWELFTFAGDRINILLGQALETITGCGISGDSLSLRVKPASTTPISESMLIQAVDQLRAEDYFSPERILSYAFRLPPSRWSKFQPLLPKELEAHFLAERIFDVQGLQDWLKSKQRILFLKE